MNPSLVEGKKTCGLEIARADGRRGARTGWRSRWATAARIAGIWKGLREMHALGLHPRACRACSACRRKGARPLVDAFRDGRRPRARRARRRWPTASASAIRATGARRCARCASRAARFVAVPDEAILEAMREAGRRAGVFGEPAGVAGLAGLRQAVREGHRRPPASPRWPWSPAAASRTCARRSAPPARRSTLRRTTPPSPITSPSGRSSVDRSARLELSRLDAAPRRHPRHPGPAGGGRRPISACPASASSSAAPSLAAHADEEVLDLDGCLVLPGFVNAHTHLYSALARGMPGPPVPPAQLPRDPRARLVAPRPRARRGDGRALRAGGRDRGRALRHHLPRRPPFLALVHPRVAGRRSSAPSNPSACARCCATR